MEYRATKYIEACNNIRICSGKNYWKEIRKLWKYRKHPTHCGLKNLNDGIIRTRREEIANIHAMHLQKCFEFTEDASFNSANKDEIDNWFKEFQDTTSLEKVALIEEEEYFECLAKGRNTAPGYDHIRRKQLRQLHYDIHDYIRSIYNFCLEKQYFPTDWKIAVVICIPKKRLRT